MSVATIWRCWLALMLLLAATTASAFVPLGSPNLVVSLAIAVRQGPDRASRSSWSFAASQRASCARSPRPASSGC